MNKGGLKGHGTSGLLPLVNERNAFPGVPMRILEEDRHLYLSIFAPTKRGYAIATTVNNTTIWTAVT